jgi:hypothetical protein
MFKHINELELTSIRTAKKGAAVITDGQVLFTISNSPILVHKLIGYCVTANDATASTVTFNADGTLGASTAITGTSASLASATAGTAIICSLATAATVPAVVASGVGIAAHSTKTLVPPGVINVTVAVGSTTGTWEWYLQYEPLAQDAVVS